MRIFCIFLLLFGGNVFGCQLNPKFNYISLSGPITYLLHQLKLLKEVKAISAFHPVKNFSGEVLAGGIFISKKYLDKYQKVVIFYDTSKELRKTLEEVSAEKLLEVDTRGLTPFQVVDKNLNDLEPYLQACEKQVAELRDEISNIKKNLLKKKSDRTYLFYLGHFKSGAKAPELLIVNDGFVKFLVDHKIIKSYPSDLAYVNWSSKTLSNIEGKTFSFGIESYEEEGMQSLKVKQDIYNLFYPAVLIPGITQVLFLKEFSKAFLTSMVKF